MGAGVSSQATVHHSGSFWVSVHLQSKGRADAHQLPSTLTSGKDRSTSSRVQAVGES